MAVGISASYVSNAQQPSYLISLTGLNSVGGYYTYTTTRVSTTTFGSGPVRGMDTVTISGATDSENDYETSFTESFYYRVDVVNVSGTVISTASTSTFNGQDVANDLRALYGQSWATVLISSTQLPSMNQLVQINSFQTWAKAGKVLSSQNVLGRRNPIVITDVGGARSGTFSVLQTIPTDLSGSQTYPNSQQKLEDLLDYGDTLMFRCLLYSPLYRDMWFKVTDVSVSRPKTWIEGWYTPADAQVGHILTYDVSFQEVDRPTTATEQFSLVTWADIKNGFATWTDVKNNNAGWIDVLNVGAS